ncbi:hypothetical protein BKA62DRAFT_42830 [Auriculariales sp. MPI-PUGE-AT-0066]|nr:hypothetical protein BKA62DRAFT_42830 [Auriculariales sp. MPI-PUGE-AT-0066]
MDGANPVMAVSFVTTKFRSSRIHLPHWITTHKRSPSPPANTSNKKYKVASKNQPAKASSGRRKGNNGLPLLPSLFSGEAQEDLSQDSDESDGSDDEDGSGRQLALVLMSPSYHGHLCERGKRPATFSTASNRTNEYSPFFPSVFNLQVTPHGYDKVCARSLAFFLACMLS